MKIMQGPMSVRRSILTFVCMLFVLAGTLAILEKTGITNFIHFGPKGPQGPTKEQVQQEQQAAQEAKKDFIENNKDTPANTPPAPTTNDITLTAQMSSNDSITILTKMHNVSSGTCKLNISNASNTYAASADVIYQPEFSSCAGFTVPISKLGRGNWHIMISIEAPNGTIVKSIDYGV